MQFNTITCKQKGKMVEPQVLKLIYDSVLVPSKLFIYVDVTCIKNMSFICISYSIV